MNQTEERHFKPTGRSLRLPRPSSCMSRRAEFEIAEERTGWSVAHHARVIRFTYNKYESRVYDKYLWEKGTSLWYKVIVGYKQGNHKKESSESTIRWIHNTSQVGRTITTIVTAAEQSCIKLSRPVCLRIILWNTIVAGLRRIGLCICRLHKLSLILNMNTLRLYLCLCLRLCCCMGRVHSLHWLHVLWCLLLDLILERIIVHWGGHGAAGCTTAYTIHIRHCVGKVWVIQRLGGGEPFCRIKL